MSDPNDPTLGLSEAEMWGFASQLHSDYGENIGDVFLRLYRAALETADRAGYNRWTRLWQMVEALHGPGERDMLH